MSRAHVVILLGSATPPGRLRRALEDAVARLADSRADADGRLLDLADVRVALADGRPPAAYDDDTAAVVDAVAAADAVVIATPVYRGSLTGVLKNVLDQLPVEALEGKPTGLVAMGASQHHFLGAERHLRDVLAFFGALVAPVAVYLSSGDFEDGVPTPAAAEQLDGLLGDVLALTEAVTGRPAPRLRPLAAATKARAVSREA